MEIEIKRGLKDGKFYLDLCFDGEPPISALTLEGQAEIQKRLTGTTPQLEDLGILGVGQGSKVRYGEQQVDVIWSEGLDLRGMPTDKILSVLESRAEDILVAIVNIDREETAKATFDAGKVQDRARQRAEKAQG